MRRVLPLLTLVVIAAVSLSVNAQSVISTHSGVINFFEGTVYLGGQPLETHLGRYPVMSLGSELRTAQGRAEVLLTPGVFVRMDEQSSLRIVANRLADTQVELLSGSVIVDSADPSPGTSVTLVYKDWWVHFLQKGTYRIDTNPPRLRVAGGYAEVFDGPDGVPVSVASGMDLPFSGVLVPERSNVESRDALSDWSNGRNESISADDAITEHIGEDVPTQASVADNFTYFPFLGVPLGLGSANQYGSLGLYQPGFSSIYLPGYTYQPFLLAPFGYGFRIISVRPVRPGIAPVMPLPVIPGRPPATHPAPTHPAPAPIHAPVRGVRPIH